MSFPCRVCTSPNRAEIDATMVTPGISDYEISRRFGIARSSVQRHRARHIVKPAQDKLAILERGSKEREERRAIAEAAASDAPPIDQLLQATTGTRALLRKLDEIERRLDRMSDRAEQGGQSTAVAALAGQQFKGLEFAAKLGGHPSFRPPSAVSQAGEKATVSIEIVFASAPKETIALTGRPVIDGDLTDPHSETPVPSPQPKQKFRGSVADYWDFSERQSAHGEDDPKEN
jgi:hypothetical protein